MRSSLNWLLNQEIVVDKQKDLKTVLRIFDVISNLCGTF